MSDSFDSRTMAHLTVGGGSLILDNNYGWFVAGSRGLVQLISRQCLRVAMTFTARCLVRPTTWFVISLQ